MVDNVSRKAIFVWRCRLFASMPTDDLSVNLTSDKKIF